MRILLTPFLCLGLFLNTACVKEEPIASDAQGTTIDVGVPPSGAGDPLAPYAWHLRNTGQKTFASNGGIAGEDSKIEELHEVEINNLGAGIRIAVSDSGTDVAHEDLGYNQLVGEHRNYALSPSLWHGSLPEVSGDDAHGTAVAGIISAVADNGVGSKGVAPHSKFAAFKFLGITGGSPLARKLHQTQGNFDIFNYSYGYPQCIFTPIESEVISAFKDGTDNLRNGRGAIYIQSSGNDYLGNFKDCIDLDIPYYFAGNTNHADDLAIPEKIIVAASNARGLASSYSTPGSGVWVSAAGGEFGVDHPAILTTDISSCSKGYSLASMFLNLFNRGGDSLNSQCNYTSQMNGTSSAAPVVSGVVALMLNANPNLTWRDVKHIIASTSDQIDSTGSNTLYHPLGVSYSLTDYPYDYKWTKNDADFYFSNTYGFGRINALKAVLMAKGYSFPLGSYTSISASSGVIDIPIPDYTGSISPVKEQLSILTDIKIESVQVTLNIDHSWPGDLALTLISPSGTRSRLLNYRSNVFAMEFPEDKKFLTNAFYQESSSGVWELEIADAEEEEAGTLKSWSIQINGAP